MATGQTEIPGVSPALMAQLEEVARRQERPVSQVITDAIDRYIDKQEWERLHAYGKAQAQKLGYTEDDVERLIAEVRQEYSECPSRGGHYAYISVFNA